MPKLTTSHPQYRRHASGQAFVVLNGRHHYLGLHGTPASHEAYDAAIAEWLANKRVSSAKPAIQLIDLALAYRKWAEGYFRKHGRPTGRAAFIKGALKRLCVDLGYSETPATKFGSAILIKVQAALAERGLSRSYVNELICVYKAMFKWAVPRDLVPLEVHQSLMAVEGLKAGRSQARDTEPIEPVDELILERTLPYLPPVVVDMVRLQRLLGCRPGEVRDLRPGQIDRTKDVWECAPAEHKTEHHGKGRKLFFGPKAQVILAPYLLRAPEAYCFSPAESNRRRIEERRAARRTSVQPSQVDRSKTGARPLRTHYTKDAYARAISRACERAFPVPPQLIAAADAEGQDEATEKARADAIEQIKAWVRRHHWHPNQLRHSAATTIRERFGLEASQHVLGHESAAMTLTYAQRSEAIAREVMRQIG